VNSSANKPLKIGLDQKHISPYNRDVFLFWELGTIVAIVLIGFILIGAVGLIGIGFALEANASRTLVDSPRADPFFDVDHINSPTPSISESTFGSGYGLPFVERFQVAVKNHPVPAYGVLETIFWLLLLMPLVDHALNPYGGTVARITWWLTIGPHELGHMICIPFGEFLTVAGGSIWQILWWLLLALYTLIVKRQITVSLIMWTITAHSFIDLSVYIGDAQERDLPLLFGLGQESHDWGNLLRWTGLVEYDGTLAGLAVVIGVVIGILAITVGILSTWLLPRQRLGNIPRFERSALRRFL
jgi:hypothetical protein